MSTYLYFFYYFFSFVLISLQTSKICGDKKPASSSWGTSILVHGKFREWFPKPKSVLWSDWTNLRQNTYPWLNNSCHFYFQNCGKEVIFGNVWRHFLLLELWGWGLLACSGWRQGILLNILQLHRTEISPHPQQRVIWLKVVSRLRNPALSLLF